MSSTNFRYSSALIIPDTSAISDPDTNQEITYILGALRTLALQIDAVTGALSPIPSDWPTIVATDSVQGNNLYKFYAQCGADIAFGAFVNFFQVGSTVQARPARANAAANAALGYCIAPSGFTNGSWGEFYVGPGINNGISGMVPGTWYYLDPVSTLGQVTAVAPTVAGQVYQLLGQAIASNMLIVGSLNNWRVL